MSARGRVVGALGFVAVLALPASAQQSIGVTVDYMGYSFDEGLGASAAQLFMVPLSVRLPLGRTFTLDVYSAWAQGKVERDDVQFELSGVIDTQVKATYQATPWALVSVGVGVPTGETSHTGEEAVVASVLATDLLGFRESNWGSGMSVTSSVATAMRAGGWGIGVAGAYSLRGEFEPSSELDLKYQPGNETRVRVGLDRNIGNSTFTAGATFRTYTSDQADGRNLFQAGNRLRFDAAYAFRAGAGVWTLYAGDVIRENGDLTLSIVDDSGAEVGDTTFVTAKQNNMVAGIVGTVGVGGGFIFRPHIDVQYQIREESDGGEEGSGWVVAAGGDFPIRLFGVYDFMPKARVLIGSIQDAEGVGIGVMGLEVTGTIRWSF